jgi:hypothetical protein
VSKERRVEWPSAPQQSRDISSRLPSRCWTELVIPNQTDIFVVNSDGALATTWLNGGPWRGLSEVSPKGIFLPGAPVVMSQQFGDSDQTDVYAVDKNGAVVIFWVVRSGPWHSKKLSTDQFSAPRCTTHRVSSGRT